MLLRGTSKTFGRGSKAVLSNVPPTTRRLSPQTRALLGLLILFAAWVMLLLMTGCGSPQGSITTDLSCGHRSKFIPDPGWSGRFTRAEKQQVAEINVGIDRDCGVPK